MPCGQDYNAIIYIYILSLKFYGHYIYSYNISWEWYFQSVQNANTVYFSLIMRAKKSIQACISALADYAPTSTYFYSPLIRLFFLIFLNQP